MSKSPSSEEVPLEYAGKWLAWDFDETKILAAADSYSEAKRLAEALGELRPVLVKAPDAQARFIGSHS